jgi:hypothetical protein
MELQFYDLFTSALDCGKQLAYGTCPLPSRVKHYVSIV